MNRPLIAGDGLVLFIFAISFILLGCHCEDGLEHKENFKPLVDAIEKDDVEMVSKNLKERPDILWVKDDLTRPPLHIAVEKGAKKVVLFLLGKGSDPNIAVYNGFTALHLSIDDLQIGKYLIDSGADLTKRDAFGKTPLQHAAFMQKPAFAKLLLESGAKMDFLTAVCLGDKAKVNVFISDDASLVNRRIYKSYSSEAKPIHLAVYFGHIELVKDLIDHGSDINETVSWSGGIGISPLYMALKYPNIFKILVEKGAETSTKFSVPGLGNDITIRDAVDKTNNTECLKILKNHVSSKHEISKGTVKVPPKQDSMPAPSESGKSPDGP